MWLILSARNGNGDAKDAIEYLKQESDITQAEVDKAEVLAAECISKKYKGCCSKYCLENGNVREFNGTGFYQKKLNGYNPYIGLEKK